MTASIWDWYLLGHQDRATVNAAIDHGERVADPRLRPIAAATASAWLTHSGWKILRRPLPVLGLLLSAVVLLVTGRWWLLLILLPISSAGLWATERQARRLGPHWAKAAQANNSSSDAT